MPWTLPLVLAAAAFAQPDPEIRTLLSAREAAAEAWPGFDLFAQPVLIVREDGSALLFAHPSPPADFRAAADGVSVSSGPRRLGGTFLTDLDVGGVSTYAQRSQPTVLDTAALAVHERFHVHQRKAFRRAPPGTYPLELPENIAWAQVEQRALAKAVEDPAVERLRAFLAVRLHRYRLAPDVVRACEREEERNEGIANYVDTLAAPGARGSKSLLAELSPEDMSKARYYETGAAIGKLLDRLGVDWKRRVEAGEGPFDVLVSAAGPVPDDELLSRVEAARVEHGFEKERSRLEGEVAELVRRREAAIRRFEQGPGRRYRVELDWDAKPDTVYSNAGPSHKTGPYQTLFERIGEYVFETKVLRLRLRSRPVWLKNPDWVEFHASDADSLRVDGRAWDGRAGRFGSIEVKEEGLELTAAGAALSLDGNVVTVRTGP